MSIPKHKILKPFYCYHPEIIVDEKVRPAFWGVEWAIVTKNGPGEPIGIHCMRQFETEEQAKGLLTELEEIMGEFGPWQAWDYQAWYLSPQYRKCVVRPKKYAFLPSFDQKLPKE